MSAIEVSNLSKQFRLYKQQRTSLREMFTLRPGTKYEQFWALHNLDFEIEAGRSFGLVGHNGSGKSTLLKIIAGIYRPTKGSVISRGRMSALLELGAGFHGDLTGRENIYLNGAILGMRRKQLESRIDEIVDFSGLEDFIDSPIKLFSSGMIVRLGFAIAVNVQPEILLVDEVTAVGDEAFQRKCMEHLYKLRRNGTTIVLVSHGLDGVRDLCDEGVWLNHGRQMQVGGIDEIIDSYLGSVNAEEAAATHSASVPEDEAIASGRVLGSGEVRVTSVQHLRDGGPANVVGTGGQLTIRINYVAREDIPAAHFVLSFYRGTGELVAQPSSHDHGLATAIPAGTGHIDFAIPDLSLLPGSFQLSTLISYKGHVFDARDRLFELNVRAASSNALGGIVRLPGQWSING